MATASPVPIIARLTSVARIWVDRNNATFARLGREVVNDGGFFTRMESPGASTTTATLEKFARYLSEAANWPEGCVPCEAVELAHVCGVTVADGAPSAGIGDESSPAVERDAA